MPTLEWIGKDKVVNHHQEVPFRILDKKYTFNAESSENMIIHGDNLLALKSLLPQYEGRVDCIYIDPPYNTGNEKWVYNDNVNDPRIKKWLGQVVGMEGEDLSRHDKWLCMIYPRLKLLHKLLAKDGIIFISIDDIEYKNQRQEVTGLIVNKKIAVSPKIIKEIDNAIYYCLKFGLASHMQKIGCDKSFYKEHLYGLAYFIKMINEDMGENYLSKLDDISWAY